jgi:hypothetical protein
MILDSKLLYLQHLLFEQLEGNAKKVVNAMKNRRVVKFFYRPPQDPDGGVIAYRDVEIYALGTNKWGKAVFYGWLKSEASKTLKSGRQRDAVRWRMFRIDGIERFIYTIQTYKADPTKPNLNKLFNKALTPLAGENKVITVFDFPEPKQKQNK